MKISFGSLKPSKVQWIREMGNIRMEKGEGGNLQQERAIRRLFPSQVSHFLEGRRGVTGRYSVLLFQLLFLVLRFLFLSLDLVQILPASRDGKPYYFFPDYFPYSLTITQRGFILAKPWLTRGRGETKKPNPEQHTPIAHANKKERVSWTKGFLSGSSFLFYLIIYIPRY